MKPQYRLHCLALSAAALTAPIAAIAGPISKWDSKKPDFDYLTRASAYDIERCIVDVDGWPLPIVYRQPDRPERTTIMYVNDVNQGAGRIDLIVEADGLRVRAWMAPKALTGCAPPAG